MQISVILAHPNPGSFNHVIAHAAAGALREAGHQVHFHDLHAERFDPLLPTAELGAAPSADPLVAEHCRQIVAADGIVIVHPNWWGQPPAILKGWIDRVLRQNVAYKFGTNDKGEGVPVGLLKAQAALVFTTSNTPADREMELFGDPLENLWKTCIFDFCGVKKFHRTNYGVVVISTLEQRKAWLADVARTVGEYFPAK
jgi:putative NADPH-quinone reductase